MVRLARGKNGLIRDNGGQASGSRTTVGVETGGWSGNDTPGRNPGDRVDDEESSWKLVKKRKTKGKKAVPAAGSEKDQQAVTDTKANRTFLEVALGDNAAIQGEVKHCCNQGQSLVH